MFYFDRKLISIDFFSHIWDDIQCLEITLQAMSYIEKNYKVLQRNNKK